MLVCERVGDYYRQFGWYRRRMQALVPLKGGQGLLLYTKNDEVIDMLEINVLKQTAEILS